MKKSFFIPLAMVIMATNSCHKLKDYWDDHNSNSQQYKSYRIATWDRGIIFPDIPFKYNFHYNSHNDPDTIIAFRHYQPDNPPNFYFVYDDQHRLNTFYWYLGSWPPAEVPNAWPTGEIARRYQFFYNSQGQISFDSLYLNGGIYSWEYAASRYFTYDPQERVTKVSFKENGVVVREVNYEYDARGNLKRNGYLYDNKPSLFRNSKILQFVALDYSKNNPFPAHYIDSTAIPIAYNEAGLPVRYNYAAADMNPFVFLDGVLIGTTFSYEKFK